MAKITIDNSVPSQRIIGKPVMTISSDKKMIYFNMALVRSLGLESEDVGIVFHYDTDRPLDWYIEVRPVAEGGLRLRSGTSSKSICSSSLISRMAKCFGMHNGEGKYLVNVAETTSNVEGLGDGLYAIISRSLKWMETEKKPRK